MSEYSTPVPDPTVLTTQQLDKEIGHIRELLTSNLDELRTLLLGHMALDTERFSKIEDQFSAAESGRIESKADTKRELDAALTAQKESAVKTEASFIKLIDQVSVSIADVKDRVTRIESGKIGGQESKSATYALIALIGSLIIIGGFIAAAWPSSP